MFIDRLLETNPFDFSDENKELFLESMRECYAKHLKNPYIKYQNDKAQFKIEALSSEEDLKKLPFLMINLLKHHEFLSVSKEDIKLCLTSSGTGGQKSQIQLDAGSLERVKKSAVNIYRSLGIIDEKKYNYLCFTYDPKIANDLGTAFTDELLTTMTQREEVYYAFQFDNKKNDFVFNEEQTIEKLKEFAKSDYPTRILGFPAHLYFLIKKYDLTIDLGADSWLQTGGGWKNHDDSKISKEDFRQLIHKHLGISSSHNRDLFGMVEHGIAYVDNAAGELKVPNYSRVFIRDPKTLEILDYNQVGLIQFMCSYNHSYASFNVLSTDWGFLRKDQNGGDILTLTGRAGMKKHAGCAISANALIGK